MVQQPRWVRLPRASHKLNAIALSQFRVSMTAVSSSLPWHHAALIRRRSHPLTDTSDSAFDTLTRAHALEFDRAAIGTRVTE